MVYPATGFWDEKVRGGVAVALVSRIWLGSSANASVLLGAREL